ncbi:MAG: hypothetical protein WEA61_02230, partial [Anaerolineales bacterium]
IKTQSPLAGRAVVAEMAAAAWFVAGGNQQIGTKTGAKAPVSFIGVCAFSNHKALCPPEIRDYFPT